MTHPNIYPNVVFDLHPKLKDILLQYARDGQIDCDQVGYPYLIKTEMVGRNHMAIVVRNGTLQSVVINPRSQKPPVLSWDPNDGYRAQSKSPIQVQVASGAPDRRERQMRTAESENPYTALVDAIVESSKCS